MINWWSEKTLKEYKRRAQCIINQYGNYTVKQIGIPINGIITQGENIADNGGIKEAYNAYGNNATIGIVIYRLDNFKQDNYNIVIFN